MERRVQNGILKSAVHQPRRIINPLRGMPNLLSTGATPQNEKELELLVIMNKIHTYQQELVMQAHPSKLLFAISDKVFQAFDSILSFEGNLLFKDFLIKIRQLLGLLVFHNRSQIPEFLAKRIFEVDMSFQENKDQIPYFELYEHVIQEFNKSLAKMKKEVSELETQKSHLEDFMKDKDSQIQRLLDDIGKLTKKEDSYFNDNIEIIITQNAALIHDNNLLRYRTEELEEDLKKFENKFFAKRSKLRDLKSVHQQLTQDHETLQKKCQKLEQENLQKTLNISQGFQNYHNSIALLKTSQVKIKNLESQVLQLEEENRRLSVRGAMAFTDLTPRHDKLKDLFQSYKIKEPLPTLSQAHSGKYFSTVSYINALFGEIEDKRHKLRDCKKQMLDQKLQFDKELKDKQDRFTHLYGGGSSGSFTQQQRTGPKKSSQITVQQSNSNYGNNSSSSQSSPKQSITNFKMKQSGGSPGQLKVEFTNSTLDFRGASQTLTLDAVVPFKSEGRRQIIIEDSSEELKIRESKEIKKLK